MRPPGGWPEEPESTVVDLRSTSTAQGTSTYDSVLLIFPIMDAQCWDRIQEYSFEGIDMKPVRMYHHESSMKTLVHIVHKEEVQYGGGFKRDYFRATSRGKGKAAFKNLEAPSDY